MRRAVVFALAVSIGLAAAALAADNTPPEGFTALFNGKDFTNWGGKGRAIAPEGDGHWKVEDGVIKFDGQGPDLWTKAKFKDFVFMVDWRFPPGKPGDSGVFLRGQAKSQINIWCAAMGSGEVWGYRTDKNMPEEVIKACTPIKKADKPVGEWNTFKITMKGEVLNVELNGELVIKDAKLPGVPPEGEIALQRHGNPIEFKNIYIQDLSAAAKSTATTKKKGG